MAKRSMLPWLSRHWPLALVLLMLLLWSLAGRGLADGLFLPVWIVATQLIVAGSLEAARLRRRAWLDQYLRDDSPWHGWLRGGAMMVLRHQLVGALLALVLLVKLRLLPPVLWPLLLAGVPGLVLARQWMRRRLARHVIGERLPAVTRRLLVPPVAGLLALVLVVAAFWLPQPWLVGLGWEEAIADHLPGGEGDSLLAFFERLAASAEFTQYWAMQNAVERLLLGPLMTLLGWLLLLLTQGAVAWAYVRLLVGVDALRRERPAVTRRHREESP